MINWLENDSSAGIRIVCLFNVSLNGSELVLEAKVRFSRAMVYNRRTGEPAMAKNIVNEIRKNTRRLFSAEQKIRIVIEGLRDLRLIAKNLSYFFRELFQFVRLLDKFHRAGACKVRYCVFFSITAGKYNGDVELGFAQLFDRLLATNPGHFIVQQNNYDLVSMLGENVDCLLAVGGCMNLKS